MLADLWSKLSSRAGKARAGGTDPGEADCTPAGPRKVLGRPLLGPTLVESGRVTPQQLTAALRRHHERGIRLGTALCELGFCGPEDIAWGLARQHDMPFVDLETPPAPSLLRRVSARVARELGIVPAARDPLGRLIVVAKNPLDIELDGKLQSVVGEPVTVAWGVEEQIDRMLAQYDRLCWRGPGDGSEGEPLLHVRRGLEQNRKS